MSAKGWILPAMANGPGNLTEPAGDRSASLGAPPPTSARLTVAKSLSFTGRATRSEVASYALAALMLSLLMWFAGMFFIPDQWNGLVENAFTALLAIPVPALLVRRMHDQGRRGRWVWLAVFSFAVWALRALVAGIQGYEARIALDQVIWPLDWLVILANLAVIVLIALPGSTGPNQFGPDPRTR